MKTTKTNLNEVPATSVYPSPMKRPLTLVAAVLFLITALIPLAFTFLPTPHTGDLSSGTTPAPYTIEDRNMTLSEKLTAISNEIEKASYTDAEEGTRSFFHTGTTIMYGALIASSLFMAAALVLMYFSPALKFNIRSSIMLVCVVASSIGVLIMAIMHSYSIILLVTRLTELPTDPTLPDQTAVDNMTTELVYYILRNALVVVGLGLYLYRTISFAFISETCKNKPVKIAKSAKHLASGYTGAALVCCLFALTIALTWKFDFITKALLYSIVSMAATSFAMIGCSREVYKHYKAIAIEAAANNTSDN